MNVVKEILKRYNVKCFSNYKIIEIKGPINIIDFVFLKRTLQQTNYSDYDIRVK